jgi:hypothetical protein
MPAGLWAGAESQLATSEATDSVPAAARARQVTPALTKATPAES